MDDFGIILGFGRAVLWRLVVAWSGLAISGASLASSKLPLLLATQGLPKRTG